MPNNPIQFLTNEAAQNEGFKKTRFVKAPDVDEDEGPPSIAPYQKEKLSANRRVLSSKRIERRQQKTIKLPSLVELVEIHFFAVFNLDLQKKFFKNYGLEVVSYSDFNKTVLFEISNWEVFRNFLHHVQLAVESPDREGYSGRPYSLIALVESFEFHTTESRIKVLTGEGCLISLVPSISEAVAVQFDALLEYLNAREIQFSFSADFPDVLEIRDLDFKGITEIAKNFDIIRVITSSHQTRIGPTSYGVPRRSYGFEVEVPDDLPVVGIIDSGVWNIDPLTPLFAPPTIDLTGKWANFDELGHGTMVAGLVAFGEDLSMEVKATYQAHAKIAIIKTLHEDHDSLDVPRLLLEIRAAYEEHGVRLFNMSVNVGDAKRYNQAFCNFAYELDKLAAELDLLVVISVGNYPSEDLKALLDRDGELYHSSHDYPTFFYDLSSTKSPHHECWYTNLLEPAESLNNISVGALAGNLEADEATDISPLSKLPAYYTRKFHYDHTQKLNGTDQSNRQHSKHLNKPDLVMDGGDLHLENSGVVILCPPNGAMGSYFGRAAGTSVAAPLVTNYAARLMRAYPQLRMQSIKALLINNAQMPAGKDPHIFRNSEIKLYQKLVGQGKPSILNLISTDDNTVAFVIEETIALDEIKVIPINLPSLMKRGGDKYHVTVTLCYSFMPVQNNQLNYLPLQITFGVFSTTDPAIIATRNADTFRIKQGVSWSDDFFGVERRQFSNTQKDDFFLSADNVNKVGGTIGLALRCVAKKEIPETDRKRLEKYEHKFSVAISITEVPEAKASGTLFSDLTAVNSVRAIADIEIEGEGTGDIELNA